MNTSSSMRSAVSGEEPRHLTSLHHELKSLSIVVPICRGDSGLEALVQELLPFTKESTTPNGIRFQIREIVLVQDGLQEESASTVRKLASRYDFVRTLWLSRPFGPHPATLAGISNSTSDWVVTLNTESSTDVTHIPNLIDAARTQNKNVVYGSLTHHSKSEWSGFAAFVLERLLGLSRYSKLGDFRLIRGEVARGLAAYCGPGVYLDAALSWVTQTGINPKTSKIDPLVRLALTSRKSPLRVLSVFGLLTTAACLITTAGFLISGTPFGVALLLLPLGFFSGLILFSLGIVAEYLDALLAQAMGKPLYLVVADPGKHAA